MIAQIIGNEIDKVETALGASMDYLRDMQTHTPGAALKFFLFMPLANHGKAASTEALVVARLVATRAEDCGPCVQAVVNGSLAAGVDASLIQTVLDERVTDLPETLQKVYAFTQAVVTIDEQAGALSEALTQELGEAAVIELSLAIATIRVFPTVKRGMGYAQSCARVKVEVA